MRLDLHLLLHVELDNNGQLGHRLLVHDELDHGGRFLRNLDLCAVSLFYCRGRDLKNAKILIKLFLGCMTCRYVTQHRECF